MGFKRCFRNVTFALYIIYIYTLDKEGLGGADVYILYGAKLHVMNSKQGGLFRLEQPRSVT